ncbi:MAG TPA: sporulation protein YqfD [Pseudogracilibacillus sp.]|nr:sporulation protein YqfD [Pseudogracilibacillus sp.]
MKIVNVKSLFGSITCRLEGQDLIDFIQYCKKNNIQLWNMNFLSNRQVEMTLYITDFKKVKAIIEPLQLELLELHQQGFFIHLSKLWQQKEQLIALFCAGIFLFLLSNTVWQVEIKQVASHLEGDINEQLIDLGIYPGALHIKELPVATIEAKMMEKLPNLLYISVKKRGTIYTIEAIEKIEERAKKAKRPGHLIARKSGIIKKMLIKEGQAVVNVNDFVKKGDILVRGSINEGENESEMAEKEKPKLVASEGTVYANTWYEMTVHSNLISKEELLQGDYITHYSLSYKKVNIPFVFWPKINYKEYMTIDEEIPLKLFQQALPFTIKKHINLNKERINITLSQTEARKKGIEHALLDLQQKLGKDAEINNYYILHEELDSGKVKLSLYVSALENIAHDRPIE